MVRDSALAPEVARNHRRLDASEYGAIYVVGDVHGCIAELQTLWDRLEPGPSDLVVFVGDLVRKGPASAEVVEFVRKNHHTVSVRGNAERDLLQGGWPPDIPESVRETLRSFPYIVSWDDIAVLHGGISPTRPLAAHAPKDLVEMRSLRSGEEYSEPFWFERYSGPPRVLFGHTVCHTPIVREWALGLDTGCVHGGELTAYNVTEDEFTSVPAEQTYRPRSKERIVDPQSL